MTDSHKYLVIVGDGMADLPLDEFGGQTFLEYAKTPVMDELASRGVVGLTQTVPEGMPPGSDTANLSIFGYDPQKYYTGRAPLEALNLGIQLGPHDVAFRCNIVSLEDGSMADFTAHHIEGAFGEKIMQGLNDLGLQDIEFYPGVSYRNIMVWRNYPGEGITETTPPHDIQLQKTAPYLPKGEGAETINSIMEKATAVVTAVALQSSGFEGTPTDIWIWGGGRKPELDSFQSKFGINGNTISAVDLIHGIGVAAGLEPVTVEGATGYIDTNYAGKVEAALEAFKTSDYVYLHLEAPDESGHEGSIEKKLKSVEDLDRLLVGPVLEGLKSFDNYSVLVMPDHPTPIRVRTHTADPVPFVLYSTGADFVGYANKSKSAVYTEKAALDSGIFVSHAYRMMDVLIKKEYSLLD